MRKKVFSISKKVIFAVFLLVLISAFFIGCGGAPYAENFTGKVPDGFADANAAVRLYEPKSGGYNTAESLTKQTNNDAFNIESAPNAAEINAGVIRVSKTTDGQKRYGLYSLAKQTLLLPCEYTAAMTISTRTYLGKDFYFVALQRNTDYAHYDISSEEFIVSPSNFRNAPTIAVSTVSMPDGDIAIERITTSKTIQNTTGGGTNTSEITTNVVSVDRHGKLHRTAAELPQTDDLADLSNIHTYPGVKSLEGITYTVSSEGIRTGYKNGSKVYEIAVDSDWDKIGRLDKYEYFVEAVLTSSNAKDYDFEGLVPGLGFYAKVKNIYRRLDLTNGKIDILKGVEYVFSPGSVSIGYDKNGNETYLIANCYYISDKTLTNKELTMVFDKNLKRIVNLSDTYYTKGYIKLDDNRYLTGSNIVDKNFRLVATLDGYTEITPLLGDKVITLRSPLTARFGVIDFDGKVVAPFDYSAAFNFLGGYAKVNNSSTGRNNVYFKLSEKKEVSLTFGTGVTENAAYGFVTITGATKSGETEYYLTGYDNIASTTGEKDLLVWKRTVAGPGAFAFYPYPNLGIMLVNIPSATSDATVTSTPWYLFKA